MGHGHRAVDVDGDVAACCRDRLVQPVPRGERLRCRGQHDD